MSATFLISEFWLNALTVAGFPAVCAFVFYSLYKEWLKLPVLNDLTRRQKFILALVFLSLTFLVFVAGIIKDSYNYNEDGKRKIKLELATLKMKCQGGTEKHINATIARGDNAFSDAVRAKQYIPDNPKNATIQYFPKDGDIDKGRFRLTLEEAGFKRENIEYRLPNNDTPTNSIWFSEDLVPLDEVKSVAYALMSAGVPVANIQPLEQERLKKQNLIQIGADPMLKDMKPCTLEEIINSDSFTQKAGCK